MLLNPPAGNVRVATPTDLPFVEALQRKFSNQLGFLPRVALAWYVDNGRVLLATENGDPAGYVLGRARLRAQQWVQPLTQTAVCMDAQRQYLGQGLLGHMERDALANGRTILQAWCRVDIEATSFWNAAGFEPLAVRSPVTARSQPLVLWRRCLDPKQRPLLHVLPAAAGWKASVATAVLPFSPAETHLLQTLIDCNELDQVTRIVRSRVK